MKIIDISEHNGLIDFAKIKEDGVKGVFIRAGFGVDFVVDEYVFENIIGCLKHNIPFGLYLYSYAVNVKEAKDEVKGFIDFIKHNSLKPLLPVVIDMEDADGYKRDNGNPSWEELSNILLTELQELEKAGFYAMYYCSTYWYQELSNHNDFSPFDFWQADWRENVEPFDFSGVWQYTEKGVVKGVETNVDMNIGFKNYPEIIVNASLNGHKPVNQQNSVKNDILQGLEELKKLAEKI